MPVTARLSRRFYDAIGDDAANDLVDWMNAVDLTYRTELLQQNEANFTRFVALLDARFTAQDAKCDARFAAIDQKFVTLEREIDLKLDTRFAAFEARMIKWMFVFWATTLATLIAVK